MVGKLNWLHFSSWCVPSNSREARGTQDQYCIVMDLSMGRQTTYKHFSGTIFYQDRKIHESGTGTSTTWSAKHEELRSASFDQERRPWLPMSPRRADLKDRLREPMGAFPPLSSRPHCPPSTVLQSSSSIKTAQRAMASLYCVATS